MRCLSNQVRHLLLVRLLQPQLDFRSHTIKFIPGNGEHYRELATKYHTKEPHNQIIISEQQGQYRMHAHWLQERKQLTCMSTVFVTSSVHHCKRTMNFSKLKILQKVHFSTVSFLSNTQHNWYKLPGDILTSNTSFLSQSGPSFEDG